jgi:hypothetical protein
MNLSKLQKYSITNDFYRKHKRDNTSKINIREKEINIKKEKKENEITSLFLVFYNLYNKVESFDLEHSNLFKIKNSFSLKFIETLKKDRVFLKQNKLKFHDIEASMLYDKDISIETLKALAMFYKINIIFINNNKYYIFENNDDDPYNIITKNKYNYNYETEIAKSDLDKKTNGCLYMESTKRNLKSIGSYKLPELKNMATILSINTDTKTKQKLYEEIIMKIE